MSVCAGLRVHVPAFMAPSPSSLEFDPGPTVGHPVEQPQLGEETWEGQ